MAGQLSLVESGKSVNNTDRQKALDAALAQIDRAFGKGSVMKLGQKEAMQVEAISTGSLGLDIALGVGGLPRGRVIEIYGPESSGKTTLALHTLAEAQKTGGTVAFVDAEHALDPVYARKLGVNIDELIVSQPDTGEQALEIVDTLVRSNAIDVLVVDSVAALVPRAEIEGEMGDSHVGLQARLMSQSLRKLTGSISRSRCMVIFINQLRMKIGVMYGNPETTTGGNALKFYASVRLDIRRTGQIKNGDEIVGNTTRVNVVKNKVAPPFKQVEFDIMYGQGISKIGEILDIGVKAGLVEKSGAWFSYDSIRIGQGRENAKNFLTENPELRERLEAAIRSRTDAVAEEMMAGPTTKATTTSDRDCYPAGSPCLNRPANGGGPPAPLTCALPLPSRSARPPLLLAPYLPVATSGACPRSASSAFRPTSTAVSNAAPPPVPPQSARCCGATAAIWRASSALKSAPTSSSPTTVIFR